MKITNQKTKSVKVVKVKAFGIYHTEMKDLADIIFEKKRDAHKHILIVSSSFVKAVPPEKIKEVLDKYKIIPIEISYKLK